MGQETQETTSTAVAPEQGNVSHQDTTTQEVNWEEKFGGLEKEHLRLKAENEQALRAVQNASAYFHSDPKGYERFQRWVDGKDLEDVVATKPADNQEAKSASAFDEKAFRESLMSEMEEKFSGYLDPVSSMQAEKDKSNLQSKYAWLTDDKYKEFEDKFEKEIQRSTDELIQRGVSPNEAGKRALGKYVSWDQEDLLFKFMRDEVLTQAVQSGRPQPKMPHGMVGKIGNNAGPSPALLDQVKKAYNESQKSQPDELATFLQKSSEQLGMTPTELFKLLNE